MARGSSKTLQIAWRNLGRNRRRTVITGVALAVGMSLCVATYGIIDGWNVAILHALTRLDLGHVQVHHPDFPRKRTLKLSLPHADQVTAAVKKLEGVKGSSARVYGYGLVALKAKSAGVQLIGVDPRTEPTVTELHEQVKHGRYLDLEPTPWPEGRKLTAKEQQLDTKLTEEAEDAVLAEIEQLGSLEKEQEAKPDARAPGAPATKRSKALTQKLADGLAPQPMRPPSVIIGSSLAKVLQAKVGSRIFVITQTLDGLTAETFCRVAGIFYTGTDLYDRTRVYMHLSDLQRFLHLENRVHEVTLLAKTPAAAPDLAAKLDRVLPNAGTLVRSWDVIRPDILSMLELNSASAGLMAFVIFIVAALGVVNTMLMAVFERTRELGMLKAIGMSGGKILWLVLVETTILVVVSSIVGTVLGLGLDLYLLFYGIDLSSFSEGISIGGMGTSPVLRAAITAEGLVVPMVTLSVMCFLAALYPAARAARMRPAQGMREV